MSTPARPLIPLLALLLAGPLGCTHAEPKAESKPFSKEAEEERIRNEMSKDIFAEGEAGSGGNASQRDASQPAPAPKAAPPPAPVRDPVADDDAALRIAEGAAKGQDPAACAATLRQARRDHPGASAPARQALLAAEVRCEEKAKDVASARDTALFWLVSCGPEAADACRSKAASTLRKLANQKPKDAEVSGLLKAMDKADACLAKLESGGKPDGCAGQAEGAYRKLDDKLMLTRLHLAQGRASQRAGEVGPAEKQLARAVGACADARCDKARDKAYAAYASLLASQGRLEEAAVARLGQNKLAGERVTPDRRRYVRLPALDEACAALDTKSGPGTCRALELKTNGGWSFHDWSAQQVGGDLDRESILKVNEEFAPTLQDCFRDQAGRLPVPSSATYKLSWMIGNDGRVAQVRIDPRQEEGQPLGACLRERFAIWRYPTSTGENQHVDQSFSISAKPR